MHTQELKRCKDVRCYQPRDHVMDVMKSCQGCPGIRSWMSWKQAMDVLEPRPEELDAEYSEREIGSRYSSKLCKWICDGMKARLVMECDTGHAHVKF